VSPLTKTIQVLWLWIRWEHRELVAVDLAEVVSVVEAEAVPSVAVAPSV
jgi:hypothetical protein